MKIMQKSNLKKTDTTITVNIADVVHLLNLITKQINQNVPSQNVRQHTSPKAYVESITRELEKTELPNLSKMLLKYQKHMNIHGEK